jgi:Tol biopolymer transport system component
MMQGVYGAPHAAWGLGLLLIAFGCSSHERDIDARRRVTSLEPVGWLSDESTLVVGRSDQLSLQDVGTPLCDSTALYLLSPSDSSVAGRAWRTGNSLCQALWERTGVSVTRDGRWLLYVHGSALMRLDLAARHSDSLVTGCFPWRADFALSPDGDRIALPADCSDPDGQAFMHVLGVDSAELRPIGAPVAGVREESPTWAPDGRRIAVARHVRGAQDSIAVIELASGRRVAVARGYAPSWSPSGVWIAYLQQASSTSPPSIRLSRDDGSQDHELVGPNAGVRVPPDAAADRGWVLGRLLWTRGGTSLVFSRGASLWRVDLDGASLRVLARTGAR